MTRYVVVHHHGHSLTWWLLIGFWWRPLLWLCEWINDELDYYFPPQGRPPIPLQESSVSNRTVEISGVYQDASVAFDGYKWLLMAPGDQPRIDLIGYQNGEPRVVVGPMSETPIAPVPPVGFGIVAEVYVAARP